MPDGICGGPGLRVFTLHIIAHIAMIANGSKSDEQLNMSVFTAVTGIGPPVLIDPKARSVI